MGMYVPDPNGFDHIIRQLFIPNSSIYRSTRTVPGCVETTKTAVATKGHLTWLCSFGCLQSKTIGIF